MQVRKLIRLLSEEIKKNPSAAYMKVCVDKRYTENSHVTFKEISDCEIRACAWENDSWGGNESERDVMVIGNY